MTDSRDADSRAVTELVERRWTRYGHDRVYVTTWAGVECGHIDLKSRLVVASQPEFDGVLRECLLRWCPDDSSIDAMASDVVLPVGTGQPVTSLALATALDQSESPTAGTPRLDRPPAVVHGATTGPGPEPRDLVTNIAGAAARAKREEVNAGAPLRNLIARAFGLKTDERSWRVGAKGETKVARQLAKLGDEWHWIHAVPVGVSGSDIDHVVIGPAGVFTLNAKCHPGARAWIGERAVMVNGNKTDYLRNSSSEGARATKLLSSACGFSITVKPVIVFVDLDDFTVKQMPQDVHVVTRKTIVRWLRSLPTTLDAATVEAVFEKARLSTTWQPARS